MMCFTCPICIACAIITAVSTMTMGALCACYKHLKKKNKV